MYSQLVGYSIFAVVFVALFAFPWMDTRILRRLPPAELGDTGGKLKFEPLYSITFGVVFSLASIVIAYSAMSQRDMAALGLAAMFLVGAAAAFMLQFPVRVEWGEGGIVRQRQIFHGYLRVAWDGVARLGGDQAWPDFIEDINGIRISLSLCRGRYALLDELRRRRPDLFGD